MKKLTFFLVILVFTFPLAADELFRLREGKSVEMNERALFDPRVELPLSEKYSASILEVEWRNGSDYKAVVVVDGTSVPSVITKHWGEVAGIIFTPQHLFTISGEELTEFPAGHMECDVGEAVLKSSVFTTSASRGKRRAVRSASEKSVVEVMSIFTIPATAVMGGTGKMIALAVNSIDFANTAFANSGVSDVYIRSAGMLNIPMDESGDAEAILARMRASKDIDLHRSDRGADLVGLWIERQVGAAYIPIGDENFVKQNGFHVMSVRGTTKPPQMLFAHELAHNLGAQHDTANAVIAPGDPYSFARGHFDCAKGFVTIMAYTEPCVRAGFPAPQWIPNFSNPAVMHNGVPTGTAEANNAKMLSIGAKKVSAYYPSKNWGL